MSYDFNGAGTQYLTIPSNDAFKFGTNDFTISLWIYTNSYATGATDVILSTYQNATTGWTFGILEQTARYYFASQGDSQRIDDPNSPILNAWVHLVATRYGTTLEFFLNGSSKGTLSDSGDLTSTSNLHVGTNVGGGGLQYNGLIAEVCIWKGYSLTTAEIQSLKIGFKASSVRREFISFYAPLVRNLIDIKGGLTITNNNSATVANHPRIYG